MKKLLMRENIKIKVGIIMFLFIMFAMTAVYFSNNYKKYEGIVESNNVEVLQYKSNNKALDENSQLYLSDLDPCDKNIGYRDLFKDKDINGNPITLKVENNWFAFEKGIFAHAKSTLVYDLTNHSEYKYFVSFIGLNSSAASSSNGAIFFFFTSNDKQNWEEVGEGILKKPGENATYVEIPLNGAKYLKLYIDDNRGNGNDHSAFGDAKFVNSLDNNFVLDSVEDYDNEIKTRFPNQTEITEELELLLLKKELVKNVGQYTINSFYNTSQENENTINWLMNNQDALRYYILGGKPDGGSYFNSLTQLTRLYTKYKNDFLLTSQTAYGTVYGDLYLRMAITLSLTHSQRVALWMQPGAKENQSDAVTRYQIFKDLHKNNKFRLNANLDVTKWFESYNIEEMRFVMNNAIDDEEILWLNEYVQYKIDTEPNKAWITPHPHMAYVWPNYGNPVYYDDANYDYFNDLFSVNGKKLYDYGITRGTNDYKLYKLWMNFRNKFGTGAVCGGISKSGSNIRATHGIPATVIGQPGHAALLYYSEDAQGRGYWGIDNDVSGWTLSEKSERLLLGWGNASYARGSYQVVYMALAQEALNDYDNLKQAEEMLMLARTYSNDEVKQETLIRKAIEIQPINIDAWYDLITLYNNSNNKTENDYYNLAEELAENLKYFPLPMYHLTNLIKPKLTSVENSYKFTLLQGRILNEAKNTPNNTTDTYYVYQPSLTRLEANFLLGKVDTSIASFSFDGADAGKIVLSSRFDGNGVRWDYSLDGKQTWKEVSFTGEEIHKLQLTQNEINSITADNDIYVHIVGVDYSENNLFKIDITEGTLLSNFYANDLENRIVGVNLTTEWRYNEQSKWTSYKDSSPDLTGDKTIQIRQAATGTKLASSPSPFYTFTQDNQPDTRKYIPVSHLTVHSVSTQATNNGGAAIYALDGNYNTRWHSAWNGTDQERYFVIKLDNSVSLSAVEFVPAGGGNGKIFDGTIYGSMDGENWEELTNLKNITYTNAANTVEEAIANIKSFEIADPKEVQYVKIVANRSNGNWFAARAFNLYQDITKNPHPTAGIAYSTTDKTNGQVVARLVNPSTKITITNNNGSDTYVFTENGEFTFEFVDEKGQTGKAIAKVDWIDKNLPTADVDYNIDNDKKIVILLENISEDVYLLDQNNKKINYIEVEDGKVKSISYLDENGNVYKITEVDENGCITKITYINTSNKVTQVKTYVTIVTNGVVTGEEYYDAEGNLITITDAEKEVLKGLQQSIANPLEYTFEESGEYEFKLLDKASNLAYKSIKVDYVGNDIIASDLSYDKTSLTNQDVTATINAFVIDERGNKSEATLINGTNKHIFIDNGMYIFRYKDSKDTIDYNIKEHIAKVTWIDKKAPTANIKYDNLENNQVKATLVNESETIIITNNNASREYIFTENGEFTFEFVDLAGNKGYAKAIVNSIKEEENPPVDNPSIDDDNNQDDNTGNTNLPSNPDGSTGNGNNSSSTNKPGNNTNNVIGYKPKPNKPTNNNNSVNNGNEDDILDEPTEPVEPVEPTEPTIPDNSGNNQTSKPNQEIKNPEDVKQTDKAKSSKFKIYAIAFIIIGLLISGIIIVRNKMKEQEFIF